MGSLLFVNRGGKNPPQVSLPASPPSAVSQSVTRSRPFFDGGLVFIPVVMFMAKVQELSVDFNS